MKAQRLPSGSYRYRIGYMENGRRKWRSFTDVDRETAKQAALRFLGSIPTSSTSSGSFGRLLARYIDARSVVCSPATIRGYRNIEKVLRSDYASFYNLSCAAMRKSDVQDLITQLSRDGKSPKTIRNYFGLITGVLFENDIPIGKVALPAKTERNITVPSSDRIQELLDACAGSKLEVPVMLGAFVGMRRGEICALRMEDVDFSGKVIHVHRNLVLGPDREYHEKPPKTRTSDRFIDMDGLEFILDAIQERGSICSYNPRSLTTAFYNKTRELFPDAPFRFHDLRHFCASFLHTVMPDAYVQKRLGWSTDATLKAVYRHTLADQEKANSQKANEQIRVTFRVTKNSESPDEVRKSEHFQSQKRAKKKPPKPA